MRVSVAAGPARSTACERNATFAVLRRATLACSAMNVGPVKQQRHKALARGRAILRSSAKAIRVPPNRPHFNRGDSQLMKTCIELTTQFGNRYRVSNEASHRAKRGERRRMQDPWLLTILCQHGHIYPHGGELLGASTNNRGPIAKRLSALPCVGVVQDGSDGINAVFHVNDFDTVAAVMKPKRRRKLSAEYCQRLADMGKANLKAYRQANVQHAGNGRGRNPTARTAPKSPDSPTAPRSASEINPTLQRTTP